MKLSVTQVNINWCAAHAAVKAAVERALHLDIRVNVAVVDRAGTRVAFLRMHGAPLHSISIAEDKAYTSASFGISTGEWKTVLEGDAELEFKLANRDRLMMLAGGLPVIVEGECIGGIGVSGGTEAQDELCAQAGLSEIFET